MIVNYFRRLRDAFFQFTSNFYETIHWKASIKSVEPINSAAEQSHSVKYMEKSTKVLGQNKKSGFNWKHMLVKDLSFQYEDKGNALSDINLNMKHCEKIAVVGSSGSGKSTFLNMLAGLYKPDNVQLIMDGKEYKDLKVIQDMCLFEPQDSEIFENTIGWNINFGFEEDEEKQRLTLARGLNFAQDKSIMLLDEVTSSVDSINERAIMQNIFDNYEDRYIICSVQRLHLLHMFDKIVVMDKGRIIQEGHFRTLWQQYMMQENAL